MQELEETSYWLELLEEMQLFSDEKLKPIQRETKELTAIFVTIAQKSEGAKRIIIILPFILSPLSFIL